MNPFENLIHELSFILGMEFKPDHNQSLTLTFPERDLSIQIDLSETGEDILIGSVLGELPPGTHRDTVIHQALRINGNVDKRRGVLAYSKKTHSLVLFDSFPLANLNTKHFCAYYLQFLEQADLWHRALAAGSFPTLEEVY